MTRVCMIVVTLALSSAVASHGQKGPPSVDSQPAPLNVAALSIDELLFEAERLIDGGSVEQASAMLNEAVRREAEHPVALALLGRYNETLGSFDAARNEYSKALKIDRSNFFANFGMGRILLAVNTPEAIERALLHLEAASKSAPPRHESATLNLLARAYRAQGSRALSVQAAEKAVETDPNNLDAWQTLVTVRTESRDFLRAAEDAKKMVDLAHAMDSAAVSDPNMVQRLTAVYETRVWALRQHQRSLLSADAEAQTAPEAQTEAAAPSVPINPDEMTMEALLATVEQLFRARQVHQGSQLLEIALRRNPRDVRALTLLGEYHELRGDLSAAREQFLRVLDSDASDFRANVGLGRAFLASDFHRQAVAYLTNAAKVAPADRLSDTLTLLARAHRGTGAKTLAIDAVERALKLDPQNMEALDVLVTVRGEIGQHDRAVQEAEMLIELASKKARENPSDLGALTRLGQAFATAEWATTKYQQSLYQITAAGTVTDRLLPGKEADAASAILRFIELKERQSQLQQLLERHRLTGLAQQATIYQPRNPTVLLRFSALLASIYRDQQALIVLKRVIEIDPTNEEARRQIAALGTTPEALGASNIGGDPVTSAPAPTP